MNEIWLIGRLTAAPEMKHTPGGKEVTEFTLAVPRENGRDETDFVDVETWEGLARACAENLVKGQEAAVKGRLQIDPYIDGQGVHRKSVKVVASKVRFLAKPKNAA